MARMFAVLGIVFQFGPLLGFVYMIGAIGQWPGPNPGEGAEAEIARMAEVVPRAFDLFTLGYFLMFAGLALLAIALRGMRYREA